MSGETLKPGVGHRRRGLTPKELHEARTRDRVTFHCPSCAIIYDGVLATARYAKPYLAWVAGVGRGRMKRFTSAADALAWLGDHGWMRYHVRQLALQREMAEIVRGDVEWPRVWPSLPRPRVGPQPRTWEWTEDGYNDYDRPLGKASFAIPSELE